MASGRKGSIRERLEARRAAMFVGRAVELERVADLLSPEGEKRFLYLTGPAGIGKTQIVHAAERMALAAGYSVTRIDGRDRAWTADELAEAIGADGSSAPRLITVDTFEAIAHLESTLRDRCVPSLPDASRVIAAGRMRLGSVWREDPGWWALSDTIEVGPISAAESEDLLLARGLSPERARTVRPDLRGHPLSLALLAEVLAHGGGGDVAGDQRALLLELVDRFLSGLSPSARRALEAASLVLHLDRELLARMLDVDDARDDYAELRRWSFVDERETSLVVHDLVRDTVVAGLAWHDRARTAELCARAGRWYFERLASTRGADEFAEVLPDAIDLLRHAGSVPIDPRGREELLVVPLWPAAWPEVEAMVLRHEGERSLDALRHWRELGASIWICRDESERVRGFASVLDLTAYTEQQAARDPGALGVWRRWRDAGVFAVGRACYMRHWMSAEAYQSICPIQTALFIQLSVLIAAPDTAAGGNTCVAPEYWRAFETEFTPRHRPALDFEVDHRRFGVVERDFLTESSQEYFCRYLAWVIEGWTAASRSAPPANEGELPRAEFERIVREALRVCDRPDLLGASELRRLRCVGAVDGPTMRDVLLEECRRLFSSPRDAVLLDVIERSYFHRALKQEALAAELRLSYSTYRRNLARATARLVDALWARER